MQLSVPEIIRLVSAIVLLISAIALVIIVLLQSNNDKGLSGTIAGGSETFYGKNKGKSIEKKLLIVTIVVASLFAVLSFVIASIQKNDTVYAMKEGWDANHDGELSTEERSYYNTYATEEFKESGLTPLILNGLHSSCDDNCQFKQKTTKSQLPALDIIFQTDFLPISNQILFKGEYIYGY